jgi:tetratricopeptide (TPR) repeat protein
MEHLITTGEVLGMKLVVFFVGVITLCLQFGCSTTDAIEPERSKVTAEAVVVALGQSEALFKQREDVAKLREAVEQLRKVRDYKQRNFEVEWKFAKYNYFLGKQLKDEKESNSAFEDGRDAGKIASGLEPSRPDGYFWYAANLGEMARRNMLTGIKSIGDVRGSMEKVIELQPNYQDSNAYDVLAQIELETRLYGGKTEKAIELLEKALETEKNNMNLHLHLGEAYLAVKKEVDAKKHLEKVLAMKPNPDYLIECREVVEKAKRLLDTRF